MLYVLANLNSVSSPNYKTLIKSITFLIKAQSSWKFYLSIALKLDNDFPFQSSSSTKKRLIMFAAISKN